VSLGNGEHHVTQLWRLWFWRCDMGFTHFLT